jgi:uncharacterized repeat protein (TIGR03803 family)
MNRTTKIAPLCIAGWLAVAAPPARAQVVNFLHTFTGGTGDGQNPTGALLLSGSTFYGMTSVGGLGGDGTIFQLGINGAGYNVIHSFLAGPTDGRNPTGSLIQSGSTLYGMSIAGGSSGDGTMFQIGADGSAFRVVHQFSGGAADGVEPFGTLLQSGGTFYGMTFQGGTANLGTIFRTAADGSSFGLLHSFAGSPTDGKNPMYATLVQSGSAFFGMTAVGGSAGDGVIFRVNTDGTGFTVLHSFAGGPADGAIPQGSLTVSGSTLYGLTSFGGATGNGTIFKIGTDGSGFGLMHSFAGGPLDGSAPEGGLVISGSNLYGTTPIGGVDALGTLFGIGTDGTGYSVMHSFGGGALDGAEPQGDLIISGATFYGLTTEGGANNDGVVFSYPISVPEPSSLPLVSAGFFTIAARRCIRRRT